jgi:hypothetical protein
MAQVISGGEDAFRLMAFGIPDQQTLSYVENQYQQLRQAVGGVANSFIEGAYALYQKQSGEEALRLAKATLRAASHFFQTNMIRPLSNIGDIQQAPLTMQRWIMADPVTRNLYHHNRIDGYSDSYVDLTPSACGEGHKDWEMVMSGRVVENTNPGEDEPEWISTTYVHGDEEEDPILSLVEQNDILSTWDLIRTMFGPGKEDPTSVYCNKM